MKNGNDKNIYANSLCNTKVFKINISEIILYMKCEEGG